MNQILANKIIEGYERIVKEVEGMCGVVSIDKYLHSQKTAHGICKYAMAVLGEDIFGDDWVMSVSNADGSICRHPRICTTKPEILQALQTRIDILKTFKENNH